MLVKNIWNEGRPGHAGKPEPCIVADHFSIHFWQHGAVIYGRKGEGFRNVDDGVTDLTVENTGQIIGKRTVAAADLGGIVGFEGFAPGVGGALARRWQGAWA